MLGMETSGIKQVAEKYGAEILPFEATLLRKIETGRALNPFHVTEAVFTHHLVINMPKMKVHRLTRYTGAIKNIYGCVVGGTKQIYHKRFQERPDYKEFWGIPLVDVYEAVMPGLTVMDAIIGLDEDGPAANGTPRKTGTLLVSANGAALDVVACRIMGFDPLWVPAVREAIGRGLVSPGSIKISGRLPKVPYVKLPDEEPKTGISKKIDDCLFDSLIVEPHIDMSKCDKCGDCVKKCGVSAISRGKWGLPLIDYKSCIRCYCCSEYCRKGAISLHGGVMNHIIRAVRSITGI